MIVPYSEFSQRNVPRFSTIVGMIGHTKACLIIDKQWNGRTVGAAVGAQLLSVRSHFVRADYMCLDPSLDIHFLRSFGVISL